MFINFESTFNLISQSVVCQIEIIVRANRFMIMIIINEIQISLFDYTIMKFTVTEISRIVQFFVVLKKILYFFIFKRS